MRTLPRWGHILNIVEAEQPQFRYVFDGQAVTGLPFVEPACLLPEGSTCHDIKAADHAKPVSEYVGFRER